MVAGEQKALTGQVWVQARSRHPAGWVTGREKCLRGLPWWFRGKESTCQRRDTGSIPGLERSHMPQGSYARVQPLLSLRAQSLCATRGASAMRSPRTATESSPRSPQLERACAQQQRSSTAINKWCFFKKRMLKKNARGGKIAKTGVLHSIIPIHVYLLAWKRSQRITQWENKLECQQCFCL